MQKRISFFLYLALLLGLLSGCGGAPAANADRLSVVTTIFPEYDWVRQILGDKADGVDLTMLLDNGVDLHSYQPTADDMVKISTCDLFIYVGGESDEWVEDALAEAINQDMVVIDLLDVLGDAVKEEEVVEGMQGEDEEGDGDEEEAEYDEHDWLSLRNAAVLCEEIAAQLGRLDAANADAYATNAAAYIEKLSALDRQYAAAVDAAPRKTLLFGDRFPFRYLTDDYGLDYYAALMVLISNQEVDRLVAQAVRMRRLRSGRFFLGHFVRRRVSQPALIRSVRFTQVEPCVRVKCPVD